MSLNDVINSLEFEGKSKYDSFIVSAKKGENIYQVVFKFKELLTADEALFFYHTMKETLSDNIGNGFEHRIEYINPINLYDALDYFRIILEDLIKAKGKLLVFRGQHVEFDGETFVINAPMGLTTYSLYTREIEKYLFVLGLNYKVNVKEIEVYKPEVKVEEKKPEPQIKVNTVVSQRQRTIAVAEVEPISNIPLDRVGIADYETINGSNYFKIRAEIFDASNRIIESKKYGDGKKRMPATIFNFKVTDYTDSILVTRFAVKEEEINDLKKLSNGDWIEVKGKAEFSLYDKDVVLKAETIKVIEKPTTTDRVDDALEKRVELHAHTIMSNMDAVSEAGDYLGTAKKWGHKAIAITDHDGVYAFTDILHYIEGKKKKGDFNVKPIYGAELNLINDNDFHITFNERDINLSDAIYTVFDIETTGFSTDFDDIIEIGAYKYRGVERLDCFEKFLLTEKKIPNKITKLTTLTNERVNAEGFDREQVIREFREFTKGTILVAHNAHFDVEFLYANFDKYGIEYEEYPVIDTLQLLRSLHFDDLKRFNLEAMTKYFKIKLEQHHRATDDALSTAESFIIMLQEVKKLGVLNYKDLNSLCLKDAWKALFPSHMTFLVKNQVGYKNLFKIVSDSLTKHMFRGARVLRGVAEEHREGLLFGTSCVNGEIFETAMNKPYKQLLEKLDFYDYVEVQPPSVYAHLAIDTYSDGETIILETIKKIIRAAKEKNKIVVATSDCHYINPDDQKYRDIYLRTKGLGGNPHPLAKFPSVTKQHLRTTKEMLEEFSFLGEQEAYEIVVKNTNIIADMIEEIQVFPKGLFDPSDDEFKDSLGVPSIEGELKRMVNENVHKMYGEQLPLIVEERLNKELNSIVSHGFCSVYYMAHILVKKSLDDGYLVGSRGSVGSSFVATMMKITEVNPLSPHYRCPRCCFSSFKMSAEDKEKYGVRPIEKDLQELLNTVDTGFDLPDAVCPICGTPLKKDGHDIPFETFLGFKGDKVPDIDLNFSGEYQEKAHNFIRDVMGFENAFRAGTLSTVAEKTAYGYVKGYAEDNGIHMRNVEIERIAKRIQGVKRSTGQHPGGIVVVPKRIEIYDITPIQYPADDTTNNFRTTHFDYHSFESNLLKLDILGHDDPTLIRYLMNYVNAHPNEFPFSNAQDIPVDDKNIYRLFNGTEVLGVTKDEILSEVGSLAIPEFGTEFVRQMLVDTKPKTFAELVKISGLSHGTDVWLNNAKELVSGEKKEFGKIEFSKIIGCRDDIMVDLMYMGLEPSRAFQIMEFVRKGKPTKEPANWPQHKEYMAEHNVPDWYIWSCGQIQYMFPKAHATAYVLMALRIAWFKVYKPLLFYAGFFSKRADAFDLHTMCSSTDDIRRRLLSLKDKEVIDNEEDSAANMSDKKIGDIVSVLRVVLEMSCRGFKFKMVDINRSEATEFVILEEEKALLCPFTAITGLGEAVAMGIVEERNKKPFESRQDVIERTKINQTIFEQMVKDGCFGDLPGEIEKEEYNLFSFD